MTHAARSETYLRVGERTALRRPTLADQEEYLALRRLSAAFHRPWEPAPQPGAETYGPEAFARYLEGAKQRSRERLLLCRIEDGVILGALNLSEIVRGPLQSAYLGYWIGSMHAGRGYMGEGVRLILRHAFETLGLHRLEANIRPENRASIALVSRNGFRREGYSPRYLHIDGEWRDHERWAILSDELPPESAPRTP